jgi:acetylornithine deacetylase/succinyl-diaminopimelate desuccinylase-like protein
LQLDRHLVPPETAESVLAELENLVESLYRKKILARIDGKGIEVRLKYRKTPYLMPQITDRNNPNVKKFEKMIKENFGEPKIVYGNSVADENVLALNGVPVITYGPSGGNMHSAGEWVSKRSYLNLIRGLKLFLEAS